MSRIHDVGYFNLDFEFKAHFQSEQRTFKTFWKMVNDFGNGMSAGEERQELRTSGKGRWKARLLPLNSL